MIRTANVNWLLELELELEKVMFPRKRKEDLKHLCHQIIKMVNSKEIQAIFFLVCVERDNKIEKGILTLEDDFAISR